MVMLELTASPRETREKMKRMRAEIQSKADFVGDGILSRRGKKGERLSLVTLKLFYL
jgi:hypothetical protein